MSAKAKFRNLDAHAYRIDIALRLAGTDLEIQLPSILPETRVSLFDAPYLRHIQSAAPVVPEVVSEPISASRPPSPSDDVAVPMFRTPIRYPTSSNAASYAIASGDFDHDGDLDLLSADYDGAFMQGSIALLRNNGNGSFAASIIVSGNAGPNIGVARLNADEHLDFVSQYSFFDSDPKFSYTVTRTSLGNGTGAFVSGGEIRTPGITDAIILGDLNGDGRSDLILAKRVWGASNIVSNIVSTRLTGSDGTFGAEKQHILSTMGNALAIAEFDGDQRMDLAVATAAGFSVLRGNGDGTFQRSDHLLDGGAGTIAVGDFNGDGRVDLAIGAASQASISILLGNGDGTFARRFNLATEGRPTGIEVQDVNGDGVADIVTKSEDGQVSLFMNNGGLGFLPRADLFDSYVYGLEVADLNGDGAPDIAAGASSPGGALVSLQANPFYQPFTPDDFNGDGRSDIFWRNTVGTTHIWEMNGLRDIGGGNTQSQTSNAWSIQDTGDFNGDGKADILWRDGDGRTLIWEMDGTDDLHFQGHRFTSSQAPTSWKVQELADFNGDGKSDILWRHEDGTTNIWLMDGAIHIGGSNTNGQTSNVWRILAAGDFTGDGNADILWRHENGTTHLWYMIGDQSQPGAGDTSVQLAAAWKFEGLGDFNGDDKADILWRHDDGRTLIWEMDGKTVVGGGSTFSQAPNFWHVEKIGDYNGDGKSDILWRHDDGSTFMWLMDGVRDIGSGFSNSQTSLEWTII